MTTTVVVWSKKGTSTKRHAATCSVVSKARVQNPRTSTLVVLTEQEAIDEELEERGYAIKDCPCVKGVR